MCDGGKEFQFERKIFSYLDDYASDIKSQLNTNRTVNTLLKSYILKPSLSKRN